GHRVALRCGIPHECHPRRIHHGGALSPPTQPRLGGGVPGGGRSHRPALEYSDVSPAFERHRRATTPACRILLPPRYRHTGNRTPALPARRTGRTEWHPGRASTL